MPSTSKKQHNFMEAIAHSPSFAKKVGVPQSVGKDFSTADKGKKFSKGGTMANTSRMNRLEELGRVDAEKATTPQGKYNLMAEKKRIIGGMKKGGMAKSDMKEDMKMDEAQDKAMIKKAFKQHDMQEHKGGKGTSLKLSSGGYTRAADGIAQRGKTKGTQIAMCGGGMAYGKKK